LKVYIVLEENGLSSDGHMIPVAAYTSRNRAEAYADKARGAQRRQRLAMDVQELDLDEDPED
jgi:hypothetical protein